MAGIFGILLADPGGSVGCPHGGKFKGTPVPTVLLDGVAACSSIGGFIPVVPCPLVPASPPFLPPCQLPLPAQTYIAGFVSTGVALVSEMALQSSVSNGFPSMLPIAKSAGTVAL